MQQILELLEEWINCFSVVKFLQVTKGEWQMSKSMVKNIRILLYFLMGITSSRSKLDYSWLKTLKQCYKLADQFIKK